MSTAAKPPPRMRIADVSIVVGAGRLLTWLAHAGRREGMTRFESAFLLYMAAHLAGNGTGSMSLSLEAIAHAIHSEPLPVRRAIDGLVRLGVLAVTPGYGLRRARSIWRCPETSRPPGASPRMIFRRFEGGP